jgi:hypothetical protein
MKVFEEPSGSKMTILHIVSVHVLPAPFEYDLI